MRVERTALGTLHICLLKSSHYPSMLGIVLGLEEKSVPLDRQMHYDHSFVFLSLLLTCGKSVDLNL